MSGEPKQQAKTPPQSSVSSEAVERMRWEYEAAARREARAWWAGFTVGLCIALSVAVVIAADLVSL